MATTTPADLLESLHWRYAVKEFDPDRRIPADTWEALVESLVLAPSSFGLQPWRFLVIEDRDLREQLVQHSWGQRQVVDCSHFVVLAAPTDLGEADVDRFAERTAEVRNVPLETLEGFRRMVKGFVAGFDPAARTTWASHQIYLALGQLMTSAAVLGIDTCPMEGFAPAEYDRLLGLPDDNLTAKVCCCLGFRSASDRYADLPKVRFPRDEVVETR